MADDASDCRAAGGSLLAGVVTSAPRFAHGAYRKGIELSHTHLPLRGDDGKSYDVAIDNVFADGYVRGSKSVPPPLDTLAQGARMEACGIPFRGGIHWVHTNCGDHPTTHDPDGWLRALAADGTPGPNLEGSQKYCYLWPHH